jgi:catechol 2,3-dioxygenase-like lactoylglutathione lyase family enzyme
MAIDVVNLLVDDYDVAIDFFVRALDFALDQDEVTVDAAGANKRWVVVRPGDGGCGLLLSRAAGVDQVSTLGAQFAGKVGFILRVDDFDVAVERMTRYGVEFAESPRDEPYGRVVVFIDVAGNKWDLIGPCGEAINDVSEPSGSSGSR